MNNYFIRAFYGSSEESLYWDEKNWEIFDRIDLNDFFVRTQPEIEIKNCLFDGSLNCDHLWKTRKTKLGRCLELDLYPEYENKDSSEHNLDFVAGMNKSDETYGWFGEKRGLQLYYNYYTNIMEEEKKAFTLQSELTSIVNFKLFKNSYLGLPYTKCVYVPPSDTYSKSACEMTQLIRQIVDKCNCQPNYLHNLPER